MSSAEQMTCSAPCTFALGESQTYVKDGTRYRKRLPWLSARCSDHGVPGSFRISRPLVECPHGCFDMDPYPCMACQGSGYVGTYAPTCTDQ